MRKIIECNEGEYETLCGIWERSVRASHGFLTDKAVLEIKSALIPDYFPAVRLYAVEDDGRLTAFIGMAQDRIEMLFVDASMRGMGYGTALLGFARDNGARFVDVNEQSGSLAILSGRRIPYYRTRRDRRSRTSLSDITSVIMIICPNTSRRSISRSRLR